MNEKFLLDIYDALYRAGVSHSDALVDICRLLLEVKASDHKEIMELPQEPLFSSAMSQILKESDITTRIQTLSDEECLSALEALIQGWNNDISNEPTRRRTPPEVKDFFQALVFYIQKKQSIFVSINQETPPNMPIIDLAVGTGSLLQGLDHSITGGSSVHLVGKDIDERAKYISQALLYFSSNQEVPDYRFILGDTLKSVTPNFKKPAIYLFDPPMSQSHQPTSDLGIGQRLSMYPSKISSEVFFLLKVLEEAVVGSWFIGLFPETITFASSPKYYQKLRQHLIQNGLRFVLKLPTTSVGRILLIGQVIRKPQQENKVWLLNFTSQPSEDSLDKLLEWLETQTSQLEPGEKITLKEMDAFLQDNGSIDESESSQDTLQVFGYGTVLNATALSKANSTFIFPQPPSLPQEDIRPLSEIFAQLEALEAEIQSALPLLKTALTENPLKSSTDNTSSHPPIEHSKTPFEIWMTEQIVDESALGKALKQLYEAQCLNSNGSIQWIPKLHITDFYTCLQTIFNEGHLLRKESKAATESSDPSISEEKLGFEFFVQPENIMKENDDGSFMTLLNAISWDQSLQAIYEILPNFQQEGYVQSFELWLKGSEDIIRGKTKMVQVLLELGLIYQSGENDPNSLQVEDIGSIGFYHPLFDMANPV